MAKSIKTMDLNFSACSAVKYCTFLKKTDCPITLYLKKQTQFFPVFSQKTMIPSNPNPIKPNSNPIQTQFLPFIALATKGKPNFWIYLTIKTPRSLR